MESQIYYRPSNQETAEYLERCLGKTSEFAHSQTVRDGTKTSQGLSEQGVPLLTAGEIKMMRDEDIIGFHRRLPPFQAKRMDWRKFPALRHRHNLAVPALPALPALTLRSGKEKKGARPYISTLSATAYYSACICLGPRGSAYRVCRKSCQHLLPALLVIYTP
jgi:type IV secretory pathway TraG/TraD family ATPase VirD4